MDDKDKEITRLRFALEIARMTIDMLRIVISGYKEREEKQVEVCKN